MKRMIEGHRRFLAKAYLEKKKLYKQLAAGQQPSALFITCSDSRVGPELITQMDPGELFVLRNAGNIVPAYGGSSDGVSATLEYAMRVLKTPNIVVCGHSGCGAMHALIHQEGLDTLPEVSKWLGHCAATRTVLDTEYRDVADDAEYLARCIEVNVITQISNLLTHPSVAARAAAGDVNIYGWVFDIPSGEVEVYDPDRHIFEPLDTESEGASFPPEWDLGNRWHVRHSF